MTFVHPLLLGGLLLAGAPILLHLIMRQKPKRLKFPAFRFLTQRYQTNKRQLRLRHLLLLLLRMALLAFLCLALARPKFGSKPVVILLFDTSASMGYVTTASGRPADRLDEARRRGLELLDQLPADTKLAVLDSSDDPGGSWVSVAAARERISGMNIQPANAPVTTRLEDAYRLLAESAGENTGREQPHALLYVFSDRTQSCWDPTRLGQLTAGRDKLTAKGLQAVFVDVGADAPETLTVSDLTLSKQIIAANDRLRVTATLAAVGRDYDTEVACRFDGEPAENKPVVIQAGQRVQVTWERRNFAQGPHFVEVRLVAGDGAFPAGAVRYAVFEVTGARKVLLVSDDAGPTGPARAWKLALEAGAGLRFDSTVLTPEKAEVLGFEALDEYQAVCLLDVRAPSAGLWGVLHKYVQKGGGLAVLPGREIDAKAYNAREAQELLPCEFVGVVVHDADDGAEWNWAEANYQHPLLEPFQAWRRDPDTDFVRNPRRANQYWDVKPRPDGARVLVSYADADKKRPDHPALLDRLFTPGGRVLVFTTTLDGRQPVWNNYLETETSFYLILAKLSMGYLAGDFAQGEFNHILSGQTVRQGVLVPLPLTPRFPGYTLSKAVKPHDLEMKGASFIATLPRPSNAGELRVTQGLEPGTYSVLGAGDGKSWLTGFSLNIPTAETDFTRTPPATVEALFGAGSVVPMDHKIDLRDALGGRWRLQIIELGPWLMVLVVLGLALENLFANRFYAPTPAADDVTPGRTAARGEPSQVPAAQASGP